MRGAELVLDARAARGEGPLWDARDQRLIWVDIDTSTVHRYDPLTGCDQWQDVGQPVGAVALRADAGLVAAVRDGFAFIKPSHMTLVAPVEIEEMGNRMNDGKVDPAGRFWAGTMASDLKPGAGTLYRLDRNLRVHAMLRGVSISNGLDWSLDGRTMYYIDSATGGLDAFDYEPEDGALSRRRRIVEIHERDGVPDGMALDAEGFIWFALWGGGCVRRYTPSGSLAAVVELPVSQVTSCAFGGPELTDLYVTSARAGLSAEQLAREPAAGGLFRFKGQVAGRAPNRFLG